MGMSRISKKIRPRRLSSRNRVGVKSALDEGDDDDSAIW